MTDLQFAILLVVLLCGFVAVGLTLPWAVERAVTTRLAELRTMMEAALAHGGSIDTLARDVRGRVESANELSRKAGEVVARVKDMVEDHDLRLRKLEEHPVIKQLGNYGGGK